MGTLQATLGAADGCCSLGDSCLFSQYRAHALKAGSVSSDAAVTSHYLLFLKYSHIWEQQFPI